MRRRRRATQRDVRTVRQRRQGADRKVSDVAGRRVVQDLVDGDGSDDAVAPDRRRRDGRLLQTLSSGLHPLGVDRLVRLQGEVHRRTNK